MVAINAYCVKPGPRALMHGVYSPLEAQRNLPVMGELVSGITGRKGEVVYYQYNAHFEAVYVDDMMIIPPEMIYAVGRRSCNEWVLFMECGKVIACPKNRLFTVGDRIKAIPARTHNLELHAANKDSLRAARMDAVFGKIIL